MPMILRDKHGLARADITDAGMTQILNSGMGELDKNPVTGVGTAYIVKYFGNLANVFARIYVHPGDYFVNKRD